MYNNRAAAGVNDAMRAEELVLGIRGRQAVRFPAS
jgi:hypothetical protein